MRRPFPHHRPAFSGPQLRAIKPGLIWAEDRLMSILPAGSVAPKKPQSTWPVNPAIVVFALVVLAVAVVHFWPQRGPGHEGAAATPTLGQVIRTCNADVAAQLGPQPPKELPYGTAADQVVALNANFQWLLDFTNLKYACYQKEGPATCAEGECTSSVTGETWIVDGIHRK